MVAAAVIQSRESAAPQSLPAEVKSLDSIPRDAMEVADAMKSAKPNDKIVLHGRISTAADAFGNDRAVFTILDDQAVASCCGGRSKPPHECKAASGAKAIIQVVNRQGEALAQPLHKRQAGAGQLQEGAEVFIEGNVASTNQTDALSINATGIYVPRSSLPAGFFEQKPPEKSADLSEFRKQSSPINKGDRITVRGLVGGSKEPFVPGRAVFTIVGSALKPCNAKEDDHCVWPWDYCCDPPADILANSATIRAADDKGHPLRTDFKNRRGIKELSDVIVTGTVASFERGSLIIDAQHIHVVKP